jgi:phage N-6-adenine-methyltransferase
MSFVARNHPQQTARRGSIAEVDDRRTPPDLLAECSELVGVAAFDLDVAASHDNAIADAYYTVDRSGLEHPWFGHVWCNPPYSDIRPWVEKAWEREADTVTMLLPANRTEQAWWQDLIEPKRRTDELATFFLRGRRRFDRPGWTVPAKGDRPPFGLVVVHFPNRRTS